MDELTGNWTFKYGGKRRNVTIDAATVAVRATQDTTRALGGADSATRAGKEGRSLWRMTREVFVDVRPALRHKPELRREVEYLIDGPWEFHWPHVGLFPDRWATYLRTQIRPAVQQSAASSPESSKALLRLDEFLAELDARNGSAPIEALRGARPGSWTRLPASVVDAAPSLRRTAGALALPVAGSVRLLTDTVFIQFGEPIALDRVQPLLREHRLVAKAMLPFVPDGVIAQLVSDEGESFAHLRSLLADPPRAFALVEPIFIEPLTGRWTPTDPHYHYQWQWNNTGANGGVAGADARIEDAWNRTRGKNTRIAVIDNGMNVEHPDLKAAIRRGGWFQDNGANPAQFVALTRQSRRSFPAGEHGTFCCGMAAARANKIGGCGAAPDSELIPIACLDDQVGTQVTLARAVSYAANPTLEDKKAVPTQGADVIVSSLGPNTADWQLSTVLELALEYATKNGRGGRGCPVFWAASNARVDITLDEVVSHKHVIAVARSNHVDGYDGAAYGSHLALVAPGVDVYSTTSSGYGVMTGCSFAAPLAAGVGALVLAREPNLTWQEVGDRLRTTCSKVGGVTYNSDGFHVEMGYGRINASSAVR